MFSSQSGISPDTSLQTPLNLSNNQVEDIYCSKIVGKRDGAVALCVFVL